MNLNKYKHVFLDRDGIVNEVIKRGNVISSPRCYEEFKFRSDFLNFSDSISNDRFNFFLVTNQPDVNRALLDINELAKMHVDVMSRLNFTKIYVCPHDNYERCACRKPRPGMIIDAIKEHNLAIDDCVLIGDSEKDLLAGRAAGIRSVILSTSYNKHLRNCERIDSLSSCL